MKYLGPDSVLLHTYKHHAYRYSENRISQLIRVCVFIFGVTQLAWAGPALVPNDHFPDVNGTVYEVERYGHVLYLGGEFTRVGEPTGSWVALDEDGNVDSSWPQVTGGSVEACIPDGQGGFYLGGNLTHVGGQPRTRLAHIQADRQVDPGWAPTADDRILDLLLNGSIVYIVGEFHQVNGQPRFYLAAVDAQTGALLPLNPIHPEPYHAYRIWQVELYDGMIYVGGYIPYDDDGQLRSRRILAINPTTGEILNWDAETDSYLHAMVATEGRLYVGGSFDVAGGQPRDNIATFDLTTTPTPTLLNWNPQLGINDANAIAVDGDSVYAAGHPIEHWWEDESELRPRAAVELDAETGEARTWEPATPGEIRAIAVTEDRVYLGGSYLVAVDREIGEKTQWRSGNDRLVKSIVVWGDRIFVGGEFESLGSAVRYGVAAIDASTGKLLPWDPRPQIAYAEQDPYVRFYSMKRYESTLYISGEFDMIGGRSRCVLAALDSQTGQALDWNAQYCSTVGRSLGQGSPYILDANEQSVWVGGHFGVIGGSQAIFGFAALDPLIGDLLTTSTPHRRVLYSGKTANAIYLGNNYSIQAYDDQWNPKPEWALTVVSPYHESTFHAMVITESAIYVKGDFTEISGVPRAGIAALDPLTAQALDWYPQVEGIVTGLFHANDLIYLTGDFTAINGESRSGLGAVDPVTGQTDPWDPGIIYDGRISVLDFFDDSFYLAGDFDLLDGSGRRNFAWFGPLAELVTAVGGWSCYRRTNKNPGNGPFFKLLYSRVS